VKCGAPVFGAVIEQLPSVLQRSREVVVKRRLLNWRLLGLDGFKGIGHGIFPLNALFQTGFDKRIKVTVEYFLRIAYSSRLIYRAQSLFPSASIGSRAEMRQELIA
jgi:hypothetical protein